MQNEKSRELWIKNDKMDSFSSKIWLAQTCSQAALKFPIYSMHTYDLITVTSFHINVASFNKQIHIKLL